MHLRLGQAARYHAQDKTPRHLPRRSRLHAQSDRLQPDPYSQIDRGIGEPAFTSPKASQMSQHTNRATDLQDRARLQFLGFSADCSVPSPGFGEKYWALSGTLSRSLASAGGFFLRLILGHSLAY